MGYARAEIDWEPLSGLVTPLLVGITSQNLSSKSTCFKFPGANAVDPWWQRPSREIYEGSKYGDERKNYQKLGKLCVQFFFLMTHKLAHQN